jgi:hypothetical protein
MRVRTFAALLGGAMLAAAALSPSPFCLLAPVTPAWGAAKPAKPAKASENAVSGDQASRAVGELAGKYKWGLSPNEVMDIIEAEIRSKYDPKIQAEKDPNAQDAVRKEMKDNIAQMRASYIRFNGQKTGWDVSLIDREFGHRNQESMLVIWEKDQRRFLFFWNEKLYKQFIAYNADKFKGFDFETFSSAMQQRYGKAQMSFAKKQTDDEMALDYYEWPPSGDFILRAYDQSGFYGNFCLGLLQKSVNPQVEKERAHNSPPRVRHTNVRVVDSITQGDSSADANADVVDEVVNKRSVPSVEQRRIQERVNREYQQNQQKK